MQPHERRRQSRSAIEGKVYLVGETEEGPFELRGNLENISATGVGISIRSHIKPGTIVWCAAPAHSLYERGQVCHSAGSLLHVGSTGIRFLAAPPRADSVD